MNEEIQIQNPIDKEDIQEIKNTIEINNQTIKNIENFLNSEKQERENNKKKQQEQEKEQKKILEQQQKEEEEKQQKEEEQLQEFYSNIETITLNTNTDLSNENLTNISTLLQVNIMASGLLIGIVVISLLAKFFRRL